MSLTEMLLAYLAAHPTVQAVVVVIGSLYPLLSAVTGLLQVIVGAFHLQGGKLDKVAHLFSTATADFAKAKNLLTPPGKGLAGLPPAAGVADFRFLVVLAAGLAVLCSSCAHVTPYEAKLIQCGEKSIQDQLPGLLPQVGSALAGGSVDWSAALDQLLAAAGEATVCAVEVSIAQLEAQEASNAPRQASAFQAVPSMVQLSRAHSWLQGAQWTRHYRASVALWAK